jgi:uncharacterized protein YjbI with pentapeptide repeats
VYWRLREANQSQANLLKVDLSGASVGHANIHRAKVATNYELEQQAASLKGATMPNDEKSKDCNESEARGKDEENAGPS